MWRGRIDLPRNWARRWPWILAEFDVRIQPRARLRAKVLIFKGVRDLNRFWREGLNRGRLGRTCRGAVNALICQRERIKPDGSIIRLRPKMDPHYFCVVGLLKNYLVMEIITHEAVHAAFAYASRRRWGTPWEGINDGLPEEDVCYPAGRIAAEINRQLFRRGLYD